MSPFAWNIPSNVFPLDVEQGVKVERRSRLSIWMEDVAALSIIVGLIIAAISLPQLSGCTPEIAPAMLGVNPQ